MQCPACTVEAPEEDLFCEGCGARLSAAPAAQGCACEELDGDGFCLQCGLKARRVQETDRIEQSLSATFAAVSDRGLRHDRNEDRFGILERAGAYAAVVCDGVSASRQSELASAAVAEGTIASLAKALDATESSEAKVRRAILEGAAQLVSQAAGSEENPPSTTVVAALVVGGEVIVGWMGDSRAYWINGVGAQALSRDHSWMNEAMREGMSAEQAAESAHAHAITRWIGADSSAEIEPEIVRRKISGPGVLLLCTDGLWNYVSTEEDMAKLLQDASAAGEDALSVARRLVEFAIGRGGQDNITAAVLRLE